MTTDAAPGHARVRHPVRWVATGVLVVTAGLVAVLASRTPAGVAEVQSPLVGKEAPALSGTILTGGRFVLPIIQDYAFMSLEPIQIEVPLHDALSSENIRVNVPSVFTVAIGIEPSTMQNAAIRLLGLDLPHITAPRSSRYLSPSSITTQAFPFAASPTFTL